MAKKMILLSFLLLFSLSNSKLEENLVQLSMNVFCSSIENPADNSWFFGKDESGFSFKTDYYDNENIFDSQKIESETHFETSISGKSDSSIYKLSCRLWKADDNNINSICRFKGQLKNDSYYLNNANFIYNNNYNISLGCKCNAFKITQYNFNIPFLYAPKQIIDINNDKNYFELKFNIELYNNEILIFFNIDIGWGSTIDLENCEKINKQLICKVSKEQLLKYMSGPAQNCRLETLINELYFPYVFDGVERIIVNSNIEKKNIYVQITKLLKKVIENSGTLVYEKNVTNIFDLTTNSFRLASSNLDMFCLLKKTEKDPLLLICQIFKFKTGEKSLGNIDEMKALETVNINYNFHIIPVNNSEVFNVLEDYGGFALYSHPQTFDYTKESSVVLYIGGDGINNIEGISLNIEKGILSCTYGTQIRICDVPNSHFDGKTDGDYYFYYTNKLGEKVRLYELTPAKVILSGKGNNSTWLYKAYMLLFVLLSLLF